MRPTHTWLLLIALLSVATSASRARAEDVADEERVIAELEEPGAPGIVAQEPDAFDRERLAYNATILDELLTRASEQTIREERFAAAAAITGGSILLGLGTWRLVEKDPQSQFSRGLGVMFLTLGMADFTTGIFAATRIAHERHRLDRWKHARRQGITAVELAHFEGELQAAQEMRQGERLLVRWNAFTHAFAGVLVLALTPIPDSMSGADRVSGYVIGGVFFAVGVATFAASFRPTPSEKAWNDYQKRRMPTRGRELSWGVAPSLSRSGVGVAFGGAF
ncbi:MAG TPA: hypothetical protein VFG22_15080 [Polyangiales bacterium]|nr:hypothetical protein [Polyangiales bacterium]